MGCGSCPRRWWVSFCWLPFSHSSHAIRAFASSFGWRVWVVALGMVLYSIALAVAVAREWVDGTVIGAHLWVAAVGIPVLTLFVFQELLLRRILARRQVLVAALVWVLFAALYLDILRAGDVTMSVSAAPGALALASALLPLSAFGLAPLSLSLIRHA
jgi:hypothetical protein